MEQRTSALSSAGRRAAPALSLASIAPAIGAGQGLEYRRLVRRQPLDRVERVYEAIWREAADSLGVELTSVGAGSFVFRSGSAVSEVENWRTKLDGAETIHRAIDKPTLDRTLANLGIPVPVHRELAVSDFRGARRFLTEQEGPCVVKPAAQSGGYGVTCGVRTPRELAGALLAAAAFDRRILIERQVPGDVHRFLFLNGQLLDIVRRRPSTVIGDGTSTVIELATAENRRRVAAGGAAGFHLIRPDLDFVLALRSAGLRPRSVPAAGRRLAVKTSNGDGGARETDTIEIAPSASLLAHVTAAVEAVGAWLAGVDVATTSVNDDSAGVVLEVNVPPGLHYHYLVSAPERATRVAVPILRCLLQLDT